MGSVQVEALPMPQRRPGQRGGGQRGSASIAARAEPGRGLWTARLAEGELALAQALVYVAVAPKSHAVSMAWYSPLSFVCGDRTRAVPLQLRNAPTQLMKDLGYKKDYRYAHDEPDAYAAGEHYLPDDVAEQRWYRPVPRGLESRIGDKLDHCANSTRRRARNRSA